MFIVNPIFGNVSPSILSSIYVDTHGGTVNNSDKDYAFINNVSAANGDLVYTSAKVFTSLFDNNANGNTYNLIGSTSWLSLVDFSIGSHTININKSSSINYISVANSASFINVLAASKLIYEGVVTEDLLIPDENGEMPYRDTVITSKASSDSITIENTSLYYTGQGSSLTIKANNSDIFMDTNASTARIDQTSDYEIEYEGGFNFRKSGSSFLNFEVGAYLEFFASNTIQMNTDDYAEIKANKGGSAVINTSSDFDYIIGKDTNNKPYTSSLTVFATGDETTELNIKLGGGSNYIYNLIESSSNIDIATGTDRIICGGSEDNLTWGNQGGYSGSHTLIGFDTLEDKINLANLSSKFAGINTLPATTNGILNNANFIVSSSATTSNQFQIRFNSSSGALFIHSGVSGQSDFQFATINVPTLIGTMNASIFTVI